MKRLPSPVRSNQGGISVVFYIVFALPVFHTHGDGKSGLSKTQRNSIGQDLHIRLFAGHELLR